MRRRAISDATQAAVGNRHVLLEHAFGLGPSPQIDITDNASNVSCRSVFSGGAFPDHTGDELCLAERLELHRAISAVHCAAFREQSRDNRCDHYPHRRGDPEKDNGRDGPINDGADQ